MVTYKNTRTGRLAEVDDDKLVVLMDRSTRWQRVEAKSSFNTVEETPDAYDPSQYGVREVNAYLADADEDERKRVLVAEAEGKARSTILNGPYSDLS